MSVCAYCGGYRKAGSKMCAACYGASRVGRTCSIDGCERPHLAKGMCLRHYHSNRNYGDPFAAKRFHGSIEERFWPKVNKQGPLILETACWTWTASVGSHGYGVFQTGRGTIGAHRQAYLLTVGRIPDGLTLDHLCRNRTCVNPDHLDPVPSEENSRRAAKALCKRGHDLTDSYIRKDNGVRQCRKCARIRSKRRKDIHIPKAIRARVFTATQGRCAYGGCPDARTIDHIIPRADRLRHGISDTDERYLVACCLTHNVLKGTRLLVPPSWAGNLPALKALVPGPWRIWRGDTREPAFREGHV